MAWFSKLIRKLLGSLALLLLVPFLARALALFCYRVWIGQPRWRTPLAAGVIVFIALQLGWTLTAIRKNPYHIAYLPTARFLKTVADTSEIIDGPLQFAFAFGFYNRFVEDPSLGYETNRMLDVVIVDERAFQPFFDGYRTHALELYNYVAVPLEQNFEKIYDRTPYRFYARRGRQKTQAGTQRYPTPTAQSLRAEHFLNR